MFLLEENKEHPIRSWLIRHFLFWIVIVNYATFSIYNKYNEGYTVSLIYLPIHMINTYILLYVVIPQLIKEKYKAFFFLILLWILILIINNIILRYFIIVPVRFAFFNKKTNVFALFSFFICAIFAVLAAIIKIFRFYYQKAKANKALLRENQIIELKLMKAQIHPHFLFNTMNNIYSLTLKQSALAPEVIKKLSSLLQYMLYECNAAEVSLKKEIEIINSYIELESIRYGKRLSITKHFSGNIDDKKIAPLLLIPFIENAFKHGSSEETNQSKIDLILQVNDQSLIFKLRNTKNEDRLITKEIANGHLGLKNVEKRLSLIYNKNYQLNINPEYGFFTVELRIDLSKANTAYLVK